MPLSVTTVYSGPFTPNGVTTIFPFDFKALDPAEVSVTDSRGDPISGLDYAVEIAAEGGNVVFGDAPEVADLASFFIASIPTFEQDVEFTPVGIFNPRTLQTPFDRTAVRDAWLKDRVDRAISFPMGEDIPVLPVAEDRAGRFLAFDAGGDIVAASGTGSDGAFRTDVAASGGAALVGYGEGLTGALDSDALAKLRALAVTPEQALGTGESIASDTLPAIKRVLDAGRPLRIPQGQTYVIEYDPASDIGGGDYSYALKVPDNAVIFCDGGTIKLADDAPDWCRVVTFEGADNVRVYGTLKVDGNAANVAVGNEHMHGVFLFDTTNFYIEAIDARNCFGDNVYIGGTDNTRGSCDGYIGRIIGITAGRKNLVGQAFDNVHIGSAWLDNTLGGSTVTGATPDTTDGDCLDIEPDSFDGSVKNRMSIGQLYTKGAGNDFTAGTSAAQADAMIVNIGSWVCDIVPRSGVPWHTHYGLTLNVDDWRVSGITATSATAELYYATRLNVGRLDIAGARADAGTPYFLASYNLAAPLINIDNLTITGSGTGFENRNGIVTIGRYRARTGGIAFWNRTLSSTAGITSELSIDVLDMANVGDPSGAGYGLLVSQDGAINQVCRIGHIRFRDTRTPKLNYIGFVGAGSSPGLTLGTLDNDTSVALFNFDGSDKYYRVSGGGVGAPGSYVSTGTPEGMITAPIGSMARRTDGGAGTTTYEKESGTGNTGWVAL